MSKNHYLLSTLIFASLLASCAKEREYDELYKESGEAGVRAKSELDTSSDFLYVPSSQGVPRFTEAMAPFVQGKERIIKFKFEEDGIVAYEMEKNPSLADNTLNNKPILKIPVDYKKYKCAENDNKECTNREEEDNELEWFQKDKFVADYAGIEVLEADSLDLPDSTDPCFYPVSNKLLKETLKLSKTDLNFTIEKTYKFSNSPGCIENLWYNSDSYEQFVKSLDNNGGAFKTKVHYSFAKLSSIASSDYKKIDYPLEDHSIFGFFKSSEEFKNANSQKVDRYVVNRWNPNKKVIDYYLSDEFDKPENKYLKDASYFAFDRMNQSLKRGGVDLQLKLHEPAGKIPGDLRNTMVVLIEDIASSLLGYGPSVSNPRTGEIVQAHTNMYKGSLESYAPYTYDSIVFLERELNKEKNETPKPAAKGNLVGKASKNKALEKVSAEKVSNNERTKQIQRTLKEVARLAKEKDSHNHGKVSAKKFRPSKSDLEGLKNRKFETDLAGKLLAKLSNENSDLVKKLKKDIKVKDVLHKNNVYTTDMFNFQSLGKVSVKDIDQVEGIRDLKGNLKDWISLTDEQKTQLTQILAKHAYIPTLIHEIGHNLGLRHNFAGSVDKDNFYTEEEREELGIESGSVYSSIMDYAYSSLNELSTFGNYDVAALRFAYNREVQLQDGSFVKVEGTDADNNFVQVPLYKISGLKKYGFCTDENAGSSLTCNRFDEGTNTKEIAKHFADKHNEEYFWRNVRNRSRNFNDVSGTWRYIVGTFYTMLDMRQIHEQWQGLYTYLAGFGLADMAKTGCTDEFRSMPNLQSFCEFVDETLEANDVAGKFFLDTIKTPDLTCDLSVTGTFQGNKFQERLPITMSKYVEDMEFQIGETESLYKPHSCFDKNNIQTFAQAAVEELCGGNQACMSAVKLTGLQVVGEVGKLHNDVDAAKRIGEDQDTDKIEIRGNWLEKAFAMEFLVNKDLLTTSGASNHLSFVDIPKYREEITNYIKHVTTGEALINPPMFTASNGLKYRSGFDVNLNTETKVPKLKSLIKEFVPIKDTENFKMGPVLVNIARKNAKSELYDSQNESEYLARNEFFDSINIVKRSTTASNINFGKSIVVTHDLETMEVGATKRNTIAKDLIERANGKQDEISEEITALRTEMDKVEEPQTDANAQDQSQGEGEQQEQQQQEEDKQTPSEAALALVTEYKGLYNIGKVDVDMILEEMAKVDQSDMSKILSKLEEIENKIGVVRYNFAQTVISMNFQIAEDANATKLMKYSLEDLQYQQLEAEQKEMVKASLKQALFNF